MARETKASPAKEQKLERYGVWVKVEPRTVMELQESESSAELTDLEGSGATSAPSREASLEGTLTMEEEKLLDELDTELGPSERGSEPSIPDEEPFLTADEELPDISEVADEGAAGSEALAPVSEEELPELQIEDEPAQISSRGGRRGVGSLESNEVEVTLSETGAGQERFEDLDALETELASVAASPGKSSAASSEILARIEDELRSIRADLTQLRNELSGIKKAGGQAGAIAEPSSGAEAQSGFFDEDEDETIALTGDELDNILNTAEITEEAAEAVPVEEAEAIVEMPEATLEESADTATEELPAELELDELSSGQTPSAASTSSEALPELDLEGIPEIETPVAAAEAVEEVGDLETLDLEEESTEVESAPESSAKKTPTEHTDEMAGDVDLEALAAEAEELESDDAGAPLQDLEIGELETIADEAEPSSAEPQEIEIAFESEADKPQGKARGGAAPERKEGPSAIPDDLKDEIRTVLQYMDRLLENLPDDKIKEFAESPHFVTYKKLFEDLGLSE
ncbi:MAG TPA: hypothetical protein VMU36_01745 [Spirochaetia bacterium]|nr:hypothetical protein [Spirochaetia bacterium]